VTVVGVASGTRLGPYEVTAKLGEGGMGEVWRATDTRLRREVALKVLPAAFVADRERLQRFEREAQLLAQLQHPNIAAIHGLEEEGGVRALAMELVEGDDLAAILARGPLPLDDALRIARQIAEALEAAHERGIVHRDLKPQNVKVRTDGTVKVLDFGLAKAMDVGGVSGSTSDFARSPTLMQSPTLTGAPGTQLGVILGTAGYMAPEQAAGKSVDRRADIWAFGVVLWEMLTGRRLFDGDSVPETLAAVLRADIDLDALPASTPVEVRRLLRRCLERQPRTRLHDAADARIVLDEVLAGKVDDAVAAPPVAAAPALPAWRRALPWVIALGGVAVGVVLALLRGVSGAPAPPATRATRFVVPAPGAGEIDGYPALSPDGRTMVCAFAPERAVSRLYLHSFDTGMGHELAGTENAEQPFWSPDGRRVGFFAAGRLRAVELATGHVESLATVSDPRGGTWTEKGDIIFAATCCSALSRVPASGGEPRPATTLDVAQGEGTHRFPWALPGGDAFLFTVADGKQRGIYWQSLRGGKRVRLLDDLARAAYDPLGFLLWSRDHALVAQRFDPRTATLAGDSFVVAPHVGSNSEKAALDYYAASSRTVATRGAESTLRELRWFDRRGTPGELLGPPGYFYDPALSADGTQVAVSRSEQANYFQADIWVFNLAARGRESRLSFTDGHAPVWSADGTTVYYDQSVGAEKFLVAKPASGVGGEQRILTVPKSFAISDSSPREPLLAVEGSTPAGAYKLWLLPLASGAGLRPFQQSSPGSQGHAAFSPDGRLVAYTSDEAGEPQVYVQSVDGAGRWQVTSEGGDLARWRADGKELYYVGLDRVLRAVAVTSLVPFASGDTQTLFALRVPSLAITSQRSYYLPSADGQRFLVNGVSGTAVEPGIEVTLDWSPASGGPPP
jgi:Tol biopolymer transport system component